MADITTGLQTINGWDKTASSKNRDIVQPDHDIVPTHKPDSMLQHCISNSALLPGKSSSPNSSLCLQDNFYMFRKPPCIRTLCSQTTHVALREHVLRGRAHRCMLCWTTRIFALQTSRQAVFPQLFHARGQSCEKLCFSLKYKKI